MIAPGLNRPRGGFGTPRSPWPHLARLGTWLSRILTYAGATHWFFESERKDADNVEAAKLAWNSIVEFQELHKKRDADGDYSMRKVSCTPRWYGSGNRGNSGWSAFSSARFLVDPERISCAESEIESQSM